MPHLSFRINCNVTLDNGWKNSSSRKRSVMNMSIFNSRSGPLEWISQSNRHSIDSLFDIDPSDVSVEIIQRDFSQLLRHRLDRFNRICPIFTFICSREKCVITHRTHFSSTFCSVHGWGEGRTKMIIDLSFIDVAEPSLSLDLKSDSSLHRHK